MEFHSGDALIYSKPKPANDGGWWEQIPATFMERVQWKNGPRFKIYITGPGGFSVPRWVHPLSVTRAENTSGESRG